MTLGQLWELNKGGALSVKHEDNAAMGEVGGVVITAEQAAVICHNLGWDDFYLDPFTIIEKTGKFIRAFKNSTNFDALHSVTVEFRNTRSNTWGKTFDRIHIENKVGFKSFSYSILYNMEGNSSPYVIYDSFTSVPVKKCRNMKQVVEFINGLS